MANKNRWIWSWHKQLLGLPSYVGAVAFVMAGFHNNWWIGLPLLVAILAVYDKLYDMSIERVPPGLKTVGLAALLLAFQGLYWLTVFVFASYLLRAQASAP
jgi:hypothetical protein